MRYFSCTRAFDTLKLVDCQAYLVGDSRDVAIEGFREQRGEPRALEHHAHLGIEPRRARVEVEGADEDPAAVHGERLGVQARVGASAETAIVALDIFRRRLGSGFSFIKPNTAAEPGLAVFRMARMDWAGGR